jgi:hypothetical protein
MSFDRPIPASHHCRHYSYDGGPKCARDVDLLSVAPCMPVSKTAVACNLREEYTDEERLAWAKWRDERAMRMLLVMAEIPGSSRDKKNRPEWGKSGEFACPACKQGKVVWARSRSNGYVRARCTTPDCFGVIE